VRTAFHSCGRNIGVDTTSPVIPTTYGDISFITTQYTNVEMNIIMATNGLIAFLRAIWNAIKMNASPTFEFANTASERPVE